MHNLPCEIYDIKIRDAATSQDQKRLNQLERSLAQAQNVGLKSRVAVISTELGLVRRDGLIETSPMTDGEIIILRACLPKLYTDTDKYGVRKIEEYPEDIPSAVLERWNTLKQSSVFGRFEIWAGEDKKSEKALVGVNGEIKYLLARWSNSEAQLQPFSAIQRKLLDRWEKTQPIASEPHYVWQIRKNRKIKAIVFGSLCSATVFIVSWFLLYLFFNKTYFLIPSVLAVIAGIGEFWYQNLTTNQALQANLFKQTLDQFTPQKREFLDKRNLTH